MTRDRDTRRLFLALWPPQSATEHLDSAIGPIRDGSPEWLRWQPRHRWHVTVLFLANRDRAQEDKAARVAARAAAAVSADPLRLAGAGRFGSVLWIGITQAPWLADLNRALARRLTPGPPERYRAHVTIARARRHSVDRETVAALAGYQGPPWRPAELALVVSHTGPTPSYETVARFPLPS